MLPITFLSQELLSNFRIIEGIFSNMANSVTVNFYWKGDIYAKKRYNGT